MWVQKFKKAILEKKTWDNHSWLQFKYCVVSSSVPSNFIIAKVHKKKEKVFLDLLKVTYPIDVEGMIKKNMSVEMDI